MPASVWGNHCAFLRLPYKRGIHWFERSCAHPKAQVMA